MSTNKPRVNKGMHNGCNTPGRFGPTPSSQFFAEAGHGNAQLFSVLGHGAAGDVVAFRVEQDPKFLVRQGLRLSSSEMASLRIFLTSRELTSSPLFVVMPSEKNDFSDNVP